MPMSKDAREREQARAEAVYRPDPAEISPAYREAWARGLPRWPMETRMPDPDDSYPPSAARVLDGLAPPRRPPGHAEDTPNSAWAALPPEERAAALEAEVAKDAGTRRFEERVARMRASGEFVDLSRDVEPPPVRKAGAQDVVAMVHLRADGGLVVSAPGAPPTRIVAVRAKRARAAAQRVAELIEEAIVARERPHDDR